MQPIAILCPSDTELAPFLPLLTELREHEQAMLRIYQGRAFWDGTVDLEEDFLRDMAKKYGLVLL